MAVRLRLDQEYETLCFFALCEDLIVTNAHKKKKRFRFRNHVCDYLSISAKSTTLYNQLNLVNDSSPCFGAGQLI